MGRYCGIYYSSVEIICCRYLDCIYWGIIDSLLLILFFNVNGVRLMKLYINVDFVVIIIFWESFLRIC